LGRRIASDGRDRTPVAGSRVTGSTIILARVSGQKAIGGVLLITPLLFVSYMDLEFLRDERGSTEVVLGGRSQAQATALLNERGRSTLLPRRLYKGQTSRKLTMERDLIEMSTEPGSTWVSVSSAY